MRLILLWCLLHAAVFCRPLLLPAAIVHQSADLPQWPEEFEGYPLDSIPLSSREQLFAREFPGEIARFTAGSTQLVARWVRRASRQVHPASDCLRGVGFEIDPKPLRVDRSGVRWGCMEARRRTERLLVCERIYDQEGQSWSDVSSWYWAAILGRTQGPWMALTASEVV
jgi:hypothetical protein